MSATTDALLTELLVEMREIKGILQHQQPGQISPKAAAMITGGLDFQMQQNRKQAASRRRSKR